VRLAWSDLADKRGAELSGELDAAEEDAAVVVPRDDPELAVWHDLLQRTNQRFVARQSEGLIGFPRETVLIAPAVGYTQTPVVSGHDTFLSQAH
jgi:hypothetical protein